MLSAAPARIATDMALRAERRMTCFMTMTSGVLPRLGW
jgi:hypothetical protein